MARELIANERSFTPVMTIFLARQRMARLVGLLVAAVRAGATRGLRCPMNLDGLMLAPGYLLSQWRNDLEVEREPRQFLRSLQTKFPEIGDTDPADIQARHKFEEFRLGDDQALGLAAAFLLNGLCVSADPAQPWDRPFVSIQRTWLGADAQIASCSVDVHHASMLEHVRVAHAEWLRLRDIPGSSVELWARRQELFPGLRFCATVEAQLLDLDRGSPMWEQIIEKLCRLDDYFRGWTGAFSPDDLGFKTTPESATTMQSHSRERTFVCPDGISRVFEWHCRMTPGAWRLFFYPDEIQRVAFIGYIGDKLPN